ncbi:hypothetical protein CBR_g50193 [Chara braunii]|uniref:Reverse transcriptase zinc-binding domain-containing protein n=1 Tax=Chara braunii TaxID=69332 RepID=A0A388M6D6_CHABU|nr:hypothetical protein CBR_g50193 [Chara braunii]|eukprot:GBG90100.1 hypothetical protein CBR_g50193 [Chara braunii]
MLMADSSPGSFGRTWVERGVVRLRDMWNEPTGNWYSDVEMEERLKPSRFIRDRRLQVLDALPEEWRLILSPWQVNPPGTWYSMQTRDTEPLFLKQVTMPPDGEPRFQQWKQEGMEEKLVVCEGEEFIKFPRGAMKEIRVKEVVDEEGNWKVRLWNQGTPISSLRVDPNQWGWRGRGAKGEMVLLDGFSLQLAYEVQTPDRSPLMAATERWRRVYSEDIEGISKALQRCWEQLAEAPYPKAAALLWVTSLLATPSAVSLLSRGLKIETQCKRCLWAFESTMHIWWDCPALRRIWEWWARQWKEWTGETLV